MRNFTKKVVATTTAVLMSASVLAGTALAANTTTANTAYQSLVDTVTSTKQVRNAFNAKSVARNAAKGTQKAGSTSSLTANQIVTNVIKIKAAGGIRSLETICAMEQAGCNRFGMGLSSALALFRDIP